MTCIIREWQFVHVVFPLPSEVNLLEMSPDVLSNESPLSSQKVWESPGCIRLLILPRRPDVGPGAVDHLRAFGGGLWHPERRRPERLPVQHASTGQDLDEACGQGIHLSTRFHVVSIACQTFPR